MQCEQINCDLFPTASNKRLALAAYIDFIYYNVCFGAIFWVAKHVIPGIESANLWLKLALFIIIETFLYKFNKWTPGKESLGIHILSNNTIDRPLTSTSHHYVEPLLYYREQWWTILFGLVALSGGLKEIIRWTMYTPPCPFFGVNLSFTLSVMISITLGILECAVGIAALRLDRRILPLAVAVYGIELASLAASWNTLPDWIRAYIYARRSYQGLPVRTGEVEQALNFMPITLVIFPLIMLGVAWLVFIKSKQPCRQAES